MIDLRKKSLPNSITVEGKDYFLNTDFRVWIDFDKYILSVKSIKDFKKFFIGDMPFADFTEQLVAFYVNANSTPNYKKTDEESLIDFIEDGEYIVASFMQDYGIDLTRENLHWHLFKALFLGLSEKTKIKEIISLRGWKDDKRKPEVIARENKNAWRLPNKNKEEFLKKQQEENKANIERYLRKLKNER